MMVAALAGASSKVCLKHDAFTSNICQATCATQQAGLLQLHCPACSKPHFGWQLSDIGMNSMCLLHKPHQCKQFACRMELHSLACKRHGDGSIMVCWGLDMQALRTRPV